MIIPQDPKNSTMRKHTVDLGSDRDSFGIAEEIAQLIDAYLLYRRAVVSANTAARPTPNNTPNSAPSFWASWVGCGLFGKPEAPLP
jgi:hypothetical protein